MTMQLTLTFPRRCRRDTTTTSRRRIWLAAGGLFRVVYSRCMFGPRRGPRAIPDVYRAERRHGPGWDVISKHRTQSAAERACCRASADEQDVAPRLEGAAA